ncbi:MAG: hypothetical protein ACKO85_11915 [Isosphaeraceae bacterium]
MNGQHRPLVQQLTTAGLCAGLLAAGLAASPIQAEDNDRPGGGFGLSRLFRFGAGQASASREHNHDHDKPSGERIIPSDIPEMARNSGTAGTSRGPVGGDVPVFQPAVTSPGFGQNTTARITPRNSYSGPVTEADPILTRVGIGRADSGSTFGLFLQVYADGTVIDSEGVHRLPTSQIRQVVNVIRGHDFSRIKGHCGLPSADFVENVQMIVYDRSLGRLRAHAFSYAGNPEGCDPSVGHLHKAVEDLVLTMAGGKPESASSMPAGASRVISSEVVNLPPTAVSQPVPVSPNVVGLPNVIEQPPVQTTIPAPAPPGNYTQGVVVPRLPSPSIPSSGNYGTAARPALTPPR